MAVHRTTPTPAVRRSARLSSPCLLATRKRARVSDSSPPEQLSLEPTPRSIRAQKRQKILDGSAAAPSVDKRAGKRKERILDDEQLDNHHRLVKKRKENIVNDTLTAVGPSSSLKISMSLDTRMRGSNNPHHRDRDEKALRSTRSSASKSPAKSKSKDVVVPSFRIMTRTMKKLSVDTPSTQTHVTSNTAIPVIPSSPDTTHPPSEPSTTSNESSDTSINDVQPSITVSSSSPSIDLPIPPSMPLSAPVPMSFLNPPLSNSIPLSMPMPLNINMSFLSMPLPMPLSIPLNMPSMSPTLAPSESELGFGFQPQEGFSTNAREGEEDKASGKEREHMFMNGERPLSRSPSPLPTPTTNENTSSPDISHPLDRPSSPPPLPPPQSCTPGLNLTSTTPTIPSRLVISTDQSHATPTSTIYSPSPSYVKPTSPSHSSPLKMVCFPPLAVLQQQQQPSPSPAMVMDERRMKDWETMAMDMVEDQRQEMDIGLSFGDVDGLGLAQPHEVGQQLDRSPPAPQLPSPQPQPSYPQLAPTPSPPPCPPSLPCSSRQYHKKIEYQNSEWTPKIDKERSLWKMACKIRVWEITKRYTPDTIRTVVAQEAHDYYSVHGFPLGYGLVPVRGRKRRRRRDGRKVVGTSTLDLGSNAGSRLDSDSASSSASMMVMTPSPATRHRDDEFMSEETYSFELLDDDDDMDGLVGGVGGGVGVGVGGLRSMEDEWRYEGFEDEDEFGFEDYDEDEDEDDLYDEDDDDDDEVEDGEGDQIFGNGMKKGVVSFTTTTTPGEDQDQDPDAEGEMEIDIEPFQDPLFNPELSSPPTSSKAKSKSRSNAVVGGETQSFVSSFYIPPVPPHVQMQMMQMQQQERQEEQQQLEAPVLAPSLDSSLSPSPSSTSLLEGTPISTSDTADHTTTANTPPTQIHLPPASSHQYQHHLTQLSSNILPLPPPRLDSVRVFILRQEMGGLKTTGRGTPVDRRRGAIWGWGGIGVNVGVGVKCGGKRRLDEGKESESEDEDQEDEGGKRGRPRLRLMHAAADHDVVERGRGRGRQGDVGNGVKMSLRLSLPGDAEAEVRMPAVPRPAGFKCDIPETDNADNGEDVEGSHGTGNKALSSLSPPPSSSSPPSSSFVATDSWDAFLASLDDKHQPRQQQQGEEGTLESSIITASDGDTTTSHGQQQLLLDHHLPNQHGHRRHQHQLLQIPMDSLSTTGVTTRRLGASLSTSVEGTSGGMFMFDQRGDDGGESEWFGDGAVSEGRSMSGGGVGSCPSDALVMEGFGFAVGADGSSTLSYALG